MSDDTWSTQLREPFDPSQVGQIPKGGAQLDYVGHGAVTARLLDVDPLWSWEPVAFDDGGLPLMERDDKGNPITLWIRLTVKGVTRYGVGTCSGGQSDPEKVLIGDAIRNAAMRFGVALDLWIKGHDDGSPNGRQESRGGENVGRVCVVCDKPITAGQPVKIPSPGVYQHKDCGVL